MSQGTPLRWNFKRLCLVAHRLGLSEKSRSKPRVQRDDLVSTKLGKAVDTHWCHVSPRQMNRPPSPSLASCREEYRESPADMNLRNKIVAFNPPRDRTKLRLQLESEHT